jgi:endonuclease/exonuclease/phosphatase (EEP) superfamily protein YafD
VRPPPLSVYVRWLLLSSATLLTVGTIGGYVSAWRYLEILADYRPYFLFGGFVVLIPTMALAHLEPHRQSSRWAIVLSGLTIALNTFEVAPWIQSGALRLGHAPAKTPFRILTFNLQTGNPRTNEILRYLESQSPDLIVLQESVGPWPDALQRLNTNYPYSAHVEQLSMDVFCRHPLIARTPQLFGASRGFITGDVEVAGHKLSVIAAHAAPRHGAGQPGFAARTRMLEEGLPAALSTTSSHFLVVGDLNATMWSAAYKKLIRRTRLLNARRGFGLVNTQHGRPPFTSWLWRPLDHCLHSSNLFPIAIRAGSDLGSDHRPLLVDFDLAL